MPLESLEISQPRFSQSLDDCIDKVVNLHITADQQSPSSCGIRVQREQLANRSLGFALSSQPAE